MTPYDKGFEAGYIDGQTGWPPQNVAGCSKEFQRGYSDGLFKGSGQEPAE